MKKNKKKELYFKREGALLFIDISGFTALSEKLGNLGKEGTEDLSSILNRFFSEMLFIVSKYQGEVLKFGGDALLIGFYGEKEYSGNIARTCSFELMEKVKEFNRIKTLSGKISLKAKIVIETGKWNELILGNNIRKEVMFSGKIIKDLMQAEDKALSNEIYFNREKIQQKLSRLPELKAFRLRNKSWKKTKVFYPEGIPEFIKAGLTGEHKYVSTVFLAISGYNEENPEYSELQNLFNYIIDTTKRYKGSINKIDISKTGSKVLITFGAPLSIERSAERAVLFAEEVIFYNDKPFSIAVSVSSGFVFGGIVGNQKDREYTVIGDAVNISARLLSKSSFGKVVVSQTTYSTLENNFIFEKLPSINVKGKKNLDRYELVKKAFEHIERTEFIGREKEIKELSELIEKGNKIIVLKGEAGIGKTRLLKEVLRKYNRTNKIFTGSGEELQENYKFIKNIIGHEIDSKGFEFDKDKKAIIYQYFQKYFTGNKSILQRVPFLTEIIFGISVPGSIYEQTDSALRFQNLCDILGYYFESFLNKSNVILFIDDIHWLKPSEVELINHLTGYLGKIRSKFKITIILSSREEFDINPKILTRSRFSVCNYTIKKLSEISTEKLIFTILNNKELESDIKQMLINKTEGNPFFIEQYLLNLIENGFLKEKKKLWVSSKRLKEEDLPLNVWTAIMSRVDKLEYIAKECLQVGSIIGVEFSSEIISKIVKKEPEQFLSITEIEGLTYKKIIKELDYVFKHALIKDVIYDSILRRKRIELHHSVGETIEKLYKKNIKEFYGILSFHFMSSQDNKKALEYLEKASKKAVAEFKNQEAIKYLETIINIREKYFKNEEEDLGTKYIELGEIYRHVGDEEKAKKIFKKVIKQFKKHPRLKHKSYFGLAKTFNDQSRINESIYFLNKIRREINVYKNENSRRINLGKVNALESWVFRIKGNMKKAFECGLEAIQLLNSIKVYTKDEKFVVLNSLSDALNNIGAIYWNQGNNKKAIEYWEKELKIGEKYNAKTIIGRAGNNLGLIYYNLGDFSKSEELYSLSYSISEERGDKNGIGITANNLGIIYYTKNDFRKAIEYYEISKKISLETGFLLGEARATGNIGWCYFQMCNYKKAQQYFQNAYELFEAVGDKWSIGWACTNLGLVQERFKNYLKAIPFFKKYLDISKELNNPAGVGEAYAYLGAVYVKMEKFKTALKYLFQAKDIFEKNQMSSATYDVYNNIGTILMKEKKKFDDAEEYFKKALKAAEGFNSVIGQANSYICLGDLECSRITKKAGNKTECLNMAESYFQKAKELKINSGIKYEIASVHSKLKEFEKFKRKIQSGK